MSKNKCIWLLTDFGEKDYYVSAMKAVILSINPGTCIMDISHHVESWNITQGAFILWQITPFLPEGSIVLAVIDPGVGTKRKGIIIETKRLHLVGPDNGLLIPAALRDNIEKVIIIDPKKLPVKNISSTFHGRDIFAPAAALLSKGVAPETLGKTTSTKNLYILKIDNYYIKNSNIYGRILHIDRFGDIITNISCKELNKLKLKKDLIIRHKGRRFNVKIVNNFEELKNAEFGIICGSSNLIEIVAYKKDAANILGARINDEIIITTNT